MFGNDFLRRAGITLLSGFVRSLLLSLILLVLFYTLLTKPLVSLIQALSGHDPRSPARMCLPCPKGHERDEIGVLVEVINRQLGRISVEIEQRREAENRLTQYLEELESIVAARTAELKAANARLTLSNQELEEARQTALDMAQARASFLANMSHEIRTPLNGLLGMLAEPRRPAHPGTAPATVDRPRLRQGAGGIAQRRARPLQVRGRATGPGTDPVRPGRPGGRHRQPPRRTPRPAWS